MRLAPAMLGATTLLVAGCEGPTQLVVAVDSDLEPRSEIAAVWATVSAEASFPASHRFEMTELELPFSFGVSPARANDEEVVVSVTAVSPDGAPLVRRVARTRFVPGAVLRLELPLSRACLRGEELCAAGEQTCDAGSCVAIDVDSSTLPRGDADEDPPELFEDPPTPPADAGPADAGACPEGEACEAGDPCRVGAVRCDSGSPRCEEVERLPEGTECGEGRLCGSDGLCGGRDGVGVDAGPS